MELGKETVKRFKPGKLKAETIGVTSYVTSMETLVYRDAPVAPVMVSGSEGGAVPAQAAGGLPVGGYATAVPFRFSQMTTAGLVALRLSR